MRAWPVLAASLLLLTSCSKGGDVATRAHGFTELPIQELMVHVVDPAAQAYWSGAGTELTAAGERDLSPTNEEGWKHIEDGAAGVIEAGNLLQIEGRVREPQAKWRDHARKLSALGVEAKDAAEAKDKAALLEIGIRLDTECDACHADFRPVPAKSS